MFLGQSQEGFLQLGFVHGREFLGHGRRRAVQRALEAHDAGGQQGRQLVAVAGNQAAPEANIHIDLAASRRRLGLEARHAHSGRAGVGGSVNDGGEAAGGRRLGGRNEALPILPTRLIDMDIGIDEARHQDQVPKVEHRLGLRVVQMGVDLLRRP